MAKPSYALWYAEQKNPTPEDRRQDRSTDPLMLQGRWRIAAARLKPDYPVAIWTEEDAAKNPTGATIFQIGRKVMNTVENADEWQDFVNGSWLKCLAVSAAEYDAALTTGKWADGKDARQFTDDEKLAQTVDLIPDTPAEEGGNAADGPTYDQQIDAKMKAEIAKRAALGKIDTQAKAETAASILEAIQALGKLGNARRDADRQPHLTAAAKVQNLWVPILTPGSTTAQQIKDDIDLFKKTEKARLQKIADDAAEAERQRLQDIADAEAEERRVALQKQLDDEAAQRGEAAEQVVIEPEKVEVVAETVAAPRVATAFGRAVSKTKKKVGVITDKAAFIAALTGQADFDEWLQAKADKLARAGTALNGMRIETE